MKLNHESIMKETLREFYYDSRMSWREIAEVLDVSRSRAYRLATDNNVRPYLNEYYKFLEYTNERNYKTRIERTLARLTNKGIN